MSALPDYPRVKDSMSSFYDDNSEIYGDIFGLWMPVHMFILSTTPAYGSKTLTTTAFLSNDFMRKQNLLVQPRFFRKRPSH